MLRVDSGAETSIQVVETCGFTKPEEHIGLTKPQKLWRAEDIYLITGAMRAGAAWVTSGACATYSKTGDGAEVAARVAAGGAADAVNTAGFGVTSTGAA